METNREAELARLRERHQQQTEAWERVKAQILALAEGQGDRTLAVPAEFFTRLDAACAPREPQLSHTAIRV